jgi:hypothetical protein
MKKNLLMAALLLQLAGVATAQSVQAQATGSATASAATFSCGGIGLDDQARMKAEASRHDVMVTFSSKGGAYVADVEIEISQGGKAVLQGRCNGPLMLVDLAPKGSYEIRATSEGKAQRKTVKVGAAKPARVSFVW